MADRPQDGPHYDYDNPWGGFRAYGAPDRRGPDMAHLDDRTGIGPGSPGGYEAAPPRHRPRHGPPWRSHYGEEPQSFDPPETHYADFGREGETYRPREMSPEDYRRRSRIYRGADFEGPRRRPADRPDEAYRQEMVRGAAYAAGYQAYPYSPDEYWWGVGPGFGFGRDFSRDLPSNPDRHPHDHRRGFWDRAADEFAAWFGDDAARARRETERDDHAGRGPKGYKRSDSRIKEDLSDLLSRDRWLDASEMEVKVKDSEVTLDGYVRRREDKKRAELWAENVLGVGHVQNNLRVDPERFSPAPGSTASTGESAVSPVGAYSTIAKNLGVK